MSNKNKKILIAVFSIFTILTIGIIIWCNVRVSVFRAKQVEVGDTYEEIVELLGNEGRDIGYGSILYEWKLRNGQSLFIRFKSSQSGDKYELIATDVGIGDPSGRRG